MFFSYFMLFATFLETKFGNRSIKKKIFEKNIYFSFNVFFIFLYDGNIEKCPFTHWL